MIIRCLFRALAVLVCLCGSSALRGEDLFRTGDSWRYFKGITEPDSNWKAPSYKDSSWAQGITPFFYGELLSGTELTDMRGRYRSIFFRREFVISDPATIGEISLDLLVDDGCLAWINGQEIARFNVPEGVLSISTDALDALQEPIGRELFRIQRPSQFLVEGTNVITVQAVNASLADSSDFIFDATLSFDRDRTAPLAAELNPVPGAHIAAIQTVEVVFDEAVRGVDAADLLAGESGASSVVQVAEGDFLFRFETITNAGPIELHWKAGHGITDRVGNSFDAAAWTVVIDPLAGAAIVSISEFLTDNEKGLRDEDKDYPDWIEISNDGAATVNLAGWSLTDDAANLGKWRFPEVELPGASYLVVFASAKNKTIAAGRLHTNFKLSKEGSYLALIDPTGKVVSEFAPRYPKQTVNVAYGRVPGTTNQFGYLSPSTPGAVNASFGLGFAPDVTFSHTTAVYTNRLDLTLKALGTNIVIRYTADGTLPNDRSSIYTKPLSIWSSVQIRARAFADGLLAGPPHSEAFVVMTNSPAHRTTFQSTLPILVMTTHTNRGVTAAKNASVTFALYEPINGRASLFNPPNWTTRGAAKVRGSSTQDESGKSAWAIEWRDEFDADKKAPILGLPAESEWVLYSPNVFDPPLIHNPFVHQLSREIGQYSPRTRFVEVYYNKGGPLSSNQWWGIYVIEERIAISKNRLDIVKLQPEDVTLPEVSGGYIFKIDRLDPGDQGFSAAGMGANGYVDPKEYEIKSPQRDPQEQYVKKFFADFGNSLKAPVRQDPEKGFRAFIDLPQWVDFHLVEVLSGSVDSMVLSTYFHKPRNGKLMFGPHWDFDRALGSTDGRDANPKLWNTGPFFSGWMGPVLSDRDAWQLWVDRWQELRQNHFSITNFNRLINELADPLRPSEPREARRWGFRPRGGSYNSELNMMRAWLSNRVTYIDSQMTQPARVSSPGGRVKPGFKISLSAATGGSIYYTTDGSDPRKTQSTNDPSRSALLYSGPIVVGGNVQIIARVRDLKKIQTGQSSSSTPWSGPISASYTVAPTALILSELMYYPAAPPAGSSHSASDFEFIELKNVSNETIDLLGYHFVEGVQYSFTSNSTVHELGPGRRVLVVANADAFFSRYPGVIGVAGEYIGRLADDGERLTLAGPVGEQIFSVDYHSRWSRLADGPGFSLVAVEEKIQENGVNDSAFWRTGSRPGGTPGAEETVRVAIPPVFLNEVVVNPDDNGDFGVELYNPNTTPVSIAGWLLSDDLEDFRKVTVGADVVVPARGYVVLGKKEMEGVRLSSHGDVLYLFSTDPEGNLTGWIHELSYGLVERNVSIGRIVGADGAEHFVVQPAPSLGLPNAKASQIMSPVQFTEILTQTPGASGAAAVPRLQFVEIRPEGTNVIALFRSDNSRLTWHLRGDVDFDMPVGFVLSNSVAIVGFDPQRDLGSLAAFREAYGFMASSQVLGPWSGSLPTSGASVRLMRPVEGVDPVPDYLLVEEIQFLNQPPWPVLEGGAGRSISSRNPGFGNDATQWFSTLPTPGDDDMDHDGLPDSWERGYGLATDSGDGRNGPEGDPDADGVLNWTELLVGSSPISAQLALNILLATIDGTEVHLPLCLKPGALYRVEFRENLGEGDWLELVHGVAGTDGRPIRVVDKVQSVTPRYYRLIVR
ncbi:MAG: hypothetical protein EXS36_13055 [Pedosphaera sp.]|nr:hypothetical protein [Pedosphaera sp.]